MKVWECKIGGGIDVSGGADHPMRVAVQRAYLELTGREAQFCFSGWGGTLTDLEREVVEVSESRALQAAIDTANQIRSEQC